jgi:transcriptional regulator of nitric oxide reductase
MAIPEDTWGELWMAGVVIALIGTSLIFKVVWEAIKSKLTKDKGK